MNQHQRSSGNKAIIKLNVGGKIFQCNAETLLSAGEGSMLAQIAQEAQRKPGEVFIDRDPELFKTLLFALRSKRLPSSLPSYVDMDLLIDEATHYGMLNFFKSCYRPLPLDGLDLEKTGALISSGRDLPSTISAYPFDGSLCLGHGNKITLYDWALRRVCTTSTDLWTVHSLHMMSPSVAAVGSPELHGLHVYDVFHNKQLKSISWSDAQDPRVYSPSVHAIASSPSSVFVSFNSAKGGGDNTIAIIDRDRLEVVDDIGRQQGLSTMVPNKLQWMDQRSLLVAGSVSGTAFGYNGQLRLFDVRSKEMIWEWKEPNMTLRKDEEKDSFADWATSDELGVIVKIGVKSGELELLDLRMFKTSESENDPWMPMEETRPSLSKGEGGASNLLTVSGRQIFCSRGSDLEVWSEVPLGIDPEEEYWETSFRRNYVDQRRNMGSGYAITSMACGGDRLFVARSELQGVEVWETRRLHRG